MFEIRMVQEMLFLLFHIKTLSKIGNFWIIFIVVVFVIVRSSICSRYSTHYRQFFW